MTKTKRNLQQRKEIDMARNAFSVKYEYSNETKNKVKFVAPDSEEHHGATTLYLDKALFADDGEYPKAVKATYSYKGA